MDGESWDLDADTQIRKMMNTDLERQMKMEVADRKDILHHLLAEKRRDQLTAAVNLEKAERELRRAQAEMEGAVRTVETIEGVLRGL